MTQRAGPWGRSRLPVILLALFLATLWIAGGASRSDVLGQVLVRSAAWAAVVTVAILGDRPRLAYSRPVLLLLLAAIGLAALQLIPLPPALWQSLPGRQLLAEAASASSQAQPWRPWSISPGATVNALSSLVVPLTMLVILSGLDRQEHQVLPGMILGFIAASMMVGLLQFSGSGFNNPLINEGVGDVSGTFANRNHFALLLAFGCLLAPVWAFLDGRQPGWRGPVALGLEILFALTILASGSRAGLLLGTAAVAIGLILVRQGIRRTLSRYPRWVFRALICSIVGLIVIFVLISIAADRAISINRALSLDTGQDMRGRGLPTVLEMIRLYFPVGSGLGGFDPIFRIHEPFEFLGFTYFNHAHNDFLEIALDAGLPGIILLLAAMMWWLWASMRVWRRGASVRYALPKLGSAMLFLVLVASLFDYPSRTPVIMAMIVVAGMWLNDGLEGRAGSALPKSG